MHRLVLLIILLTVHCWMFTGSQHIRADNPQNDQENPEVTINILSRPVRLLAANQIKHIVFNVTAELIVEVAVPGESVPHQHILAPGSALRMLYQGGRYQLQANATTLENPCAITMRAAENNANSNIIAIQYAEVRRRYPLPMHIALNRTQPLFHVKEKLNNYSMSSALAEYGRRPAQEKEAVLALAHVIRARYFYQKRVSASRHSHADFCDLTHCQVYKGQFYTNWYFTDRIVIDSQHLSENLYFHANTWGHTLGTSVFGRSGKPGVRDWLYRQRLNLGKKSTWRREITKHELAGLLFPKQERYSDIVLDYDRANMLITATTGTDKKKLAPETFRLIINRKKGWSFIKSNEYSIAESIKDNEKAYIFTGTGLGHGAGLSQEGALDLARKGYNRYEILDHYYPELVFRSLTSESMDTPYLLYALFDLETGNIRHISNPSMLNRISPPGSIFKLVVALYLAKERPDLFQEHVYTCPGINRHDHHMPKKCWNRQGHGKLFLTEALSHSCNLWFASLSKKIAYPSFCRFFKELCHALDIQCALPVSIVKSQWADLLAGIDFSISFSVSDYMKLARLISPIKTTNTRLEHFKNKIPLDMRLAIFAALHNTFIEGTASGQIKHSGSALNYKPLKIIEKKQNYDMMKNEIWGKTSTVIDGTNLPVAYGQFVGGYKNMGIVLILRKGYGHTAARWARVLLSN